MQGRPAQEEGAVSPAGGWRRAPRAGARWGDLGVGSEVERGHLHAGLGGCSISKQLMTGYKAQQKQTHTHRLDRPACLPACHGALRTTLHLSALSWALKETTAFNPMPLSGSVLWFPNHPTSHGMTASKPGKALSPLEPCPCGSSFPRSLCPQCSLRMRSKLLPKARLDPPRKGSCG